MGWAASVGEQRDREGQRGLGKAGPAVFLSPPLITLRGCSHSSQCKMATQKGINWPASEQPGGISHPCHLEQGGSGGWESGAFVAAPGYLHV